MYRQPGYFCYEAASCRPNPNPKVLNTHHYVLSSFRMIVLTQSVLTRKTLHVDDISAFKNDTTAPEKGVNQTTNEPWTPDRRSGAAGRPKCR